MPKRASTPSPKASQPRYTKVVLDLPGESFLRSLTESDGQPYTDEIYRVAAMLARDHGLDPTFGVLWHLTPSRAGACWTLQTANGVSMFTPKHPPGDLTVEVNAAWQLAAALVDWRRGSVELTTAHRTLSVHYMRED